MIQEISSHWFVSFVVYIKVYVLAIFSLNLALSLVEYIMSSSNYSSRTNYKTCSKTYDRLAFLAFKVRLNDAYCRETLLQIGIATDLFLSRTFKNIFLNGSNLMIFLEDICKQIWIRNFIIIGGFWDAADSWLLFIANRKMLLMMIGISGWLIKKRETRR